jgi:LDH2 family malate/lactate/ureidoglycolate dehydrogenase
MTLIAIAPQSGFGGLARDLSSHIRASPPLDPARPVLMPGDRENTAAAAMKKIRLDGPIWTALIAAANTANIALPTPVAGEI